MRLNPVELAAELSYTLCFVLGLLTGLLSFSYVMRKAGLGFKVLKKSSKPVPALRGSARNSAAVNASTDFQKIQTAEIEIPVIAEDVLEYQPGELGDAYPEATRLFYSAEALQDPEYLETVLRSPLQVQTHNKNTGEHNRDVDGWPVSVAWDETSRRVIAKGVVHGAANVQYVKENEGKPTFGTSAFISFIKVDKQPGIAPNGKPYDAVVRKAVNNHIAILPNIRDPKNVILAMNAVEPEQMKEDETQNAQDRTKKGERKDPAFSDAEWETLSAESKDRALRRIDAGGRFYGPDPKTKSSNQATNTEEGKKLEYEEFKGHMNAYEEEKKGNEKLVEEITNNVIAKMNATKNEGGEKKDEPKKEDAANEDTGKPVEEKPGSEEAANALPSDAMVKDFSDALGITFAKTPTLAQLASVAGVTGEGPAGLIAALNAKRETFKKEPAVSAVNSGESQKTVSDLIKSF